MNNEEKKEEFVNEQDKAISEMLAKFDEKGYASHTYDPEAEVTVSGKTMIAFINTLSVQKQLIESSQVTINTISAAYDKMLDRLAGVQLYMMEEHFKNCEAGKTITAEQADAIDAKSKIQTQDA